MAKQEFVSVGKSLCDAYHHKHIISDFLVRFSSHLSLAPLQRRGKQEESVKTLLGLSCHCHTMLFLDIWVCLQVTLHVLVRSNVLITVNYS